MIFSWNRIRINDLADHRGIDGFLFYDTRQTRLSFISFSLSIKFRFVYYIGHMTRALKHILSNFRKQYIILDNPEREICSFTEFVPFCHKLYFISNYKDFNTPAQA